MKKTLCGMLVCLLVLLPAVSFPVAADVGASLEIKIFGGLPLPLLFHQVGGAISNVGDAAATNISYLLTIKGGVLGAIDESQDGFIDEILPHNGFGVSILGTYGFGPVTVTLNASAENAENVSGSARGFQLREFTWVPFSWITP